MNYDRVKKPTDVKIEGVTFDFETRDGMVASVTITGKDGGHVKMSSDYGLTVLVPAKPKMVKRWALRGETLGLKVDVSFDSKYDAERRRDEIDQGVAPGGDMKHSLTIEEVEVPE